MSETKSKGGKSNGSAPSSTEKWSYEKIEDLPEEQDYFAKKLPQHLMVDDPSLNWFQKPHTITVMAIALIVLIFGAFTREGTETVANVKFGLCAGAVVFLVFCLLYLHDGPFVRPHPAVWRVVTGIGILYLCSLVWILFQNVNDVRQFLKYFDERLGKPLPERSYAADCDLYTPDDPSSNFRHLMDTVNDEFVLAHVVGWFAKTLLLRDAYLCLFLSIMFEIWEMTFQHQLPNFAECWWDHVILDILICNNIGIIVGMITCRYLFKMKEFNWTGLWATKQGKIVRSFVPTSFDEYRWEFLSNWKRFVSVLLLCIAVSIIELNAFYLKYILWVPPPHPLNIIRLCLWMFMGLPALREYYQFVSDPKCKKMGSMTWLCTLVFCTEGLICIKFGRGMFPDPTPPEVFWPWVIFLVGGSLAAVIYFYRKETQQNGEGKAHGNGNGNGNGKRKKNKKTKESSMAALSEASVGEASNDSSKGSNHNNHGDGSKKNK